MHLQKPLYAFILLLSLYFIGQTISSYKSVSTRLCNPVFKEERQKKLSQLEIIVALSIVLFIVNAILLLECSITKIKLSNKLGIAANIVLLIVISIFSKIVSEDSMNYVFFGSLIGIILYVGYFGYEYYFNKNKHNQVFPTKNDNSPEIDDESRKSAEHNQVFPTKNGNSPEIDDESRKWAEYAGVLKKKDVKDLKNIFTKKLTQERQKKFDDEIRKKEKNEQKRINEAQKLTNEVADYWADGSNWN